MNSDDPKITAYALGEVGEEMLLDGEAKRIVEETVLVAAVLRRHLRRSRRTMNLVRYAVAACLMLAVGGIGFVLSRSGPRERDLSASVGAPVAQGEKVREPILHLTPKLADLNSYSSVANAEFKGDRTQDVQELVEAVLQDASRVGSVRSLRLMPEELVVVQ